MHNQIVKITNDFIVDGKLNKEQWKLANWSNRFVDIIGNTPSIYNTQAAVLYSDEYLYIGFYCESPFPKADLTEDGSLLWFDSIVEVMIDGGDTYYELQVNALNTTYEAFYIWKDAYKNNDVYRKQAEFDVLSDDVRIFGGNHDRTGKYFWNGSHPRGNRWAFLNYKMKNLQTAVYVDGTLNSDEKISNYVSYEIRIPWEDLKWLRNGEVNAPVSTEQVNIFLGRFENLTINGEIISHGTSITAIGSDDNHYPEKFTKFEYTNTK